MSNHRDMPSVDEIEAHVRRAHRLRAETLAHVLNGIGAWCLGSSRRPGGLPDAPASADPGTATAFRQHVAAVRLSAEVLLDDATLAPDDRARAHDVLLDMERHLDALRAMISPREPGY